MDARELIESGKEDDPGKRAHLGKEVEVEGIWMIKVELVFKG